MVFQDPSATLNAVLTIGEQMALAIEAHESVSRKAALARAAEALKLVGIPDAARRLFCVAAPVLGGHAPARRHRHRHSDRPKLIICDEPTTALDVSIQAQILTEMRGLARDLGTAMIWISHDLATVSSLASRILVMYAGRIIESGPIREVLRAPPPPYARGLLDSLPANARAGADLVQIPGATPSLADLPQGCAFAPRCGRAGPECVEEPALVGDGVRAARCWRPIRDEAAR